jgi:hypothetical protein
MHPDRYRDRHGKLGHSNGHSPPQLKKHSSSWVRTAEFSSAISIWGKRESHKANNAPIHEHNGTLVCPSHLFLVRNIYTLQKCTYRKIRDRKHRWAKRFLLTISHVISYGLLHVTGRKYEPRDTVCYCWPHRAYITFGKGMMRMGPLV